MTRKSSFVGIGILLAIFITLWLLPLPSNILHSSARIVLLDRNGLELFTSGKDRETGTLKLQELPTCLVPALVATEDRTFFEHRGISIRGLLRAAVSNLLHGGVREGGSTITQQLIRSRLKPTSRGLGYKIREMWYAVKLEGILSKTEILEQHLDTVYLGQGAYGVRDASLQYFGKLVQDLTLPECALLVGLMNAPSALSPEKSPNMAKERQEYVLASMKETGAISGEMYHESVNEKIHYQSWKRSIRAPHFVFWVLGGLNGGTAGRIQTTLDLSLQEDVERIIDHQLDKLSEKNVTSAAVIVLDAKTGDILSMVGSSDFFNSELSGQVNVATSARQPGSTLKPFTYALALENGMTTATTLEDSEVTFLTKDGNPYTPRNYDFDVHGLVRLRTALANSYNIAAVKVLERVGVSTLLSRLRALGISTLTESPDHYGLALTLGSGEVTLLELASAYGTFPRLGLTLRPRSLLSQPHQPPERAFSPQVAWLISDILSDSNARLPQFGESTSFGFSVPVAVKTGTTRNSRDNWAVGYSRDRIVGVWVGNANNQPMRGTSGVTGAGPIFHDVMIRALTPDARLGFKRPPNILEVEVCELSGLLPTKYCERLIKEKFIAGTEPRQKDNVFRVTNIDTRNSLLATEDCPKQFVTSKVLMHLPASTRSWGKEKGFLLAPDRWSPLCASGSSKSLVNTFRISRPHDNSTFLLDPLIPDEHEQIILEAESELPLNSVEWFVDGKSLGTSQKPPYRLYYRPTPGPHTLKAEGADESSHINILVEDEKDVRS